MKKRMPRVQTITAFKQKAAPRAKNSTIDRNGVHLMRLWQKEARKQLEGKKYRVIIAPTGSGKSHLIKVLSAIELDKDPRRKVVICIPQDLILGSFGPV